MKKDPEIIKILTDLNLRPQTDLTPEQEHQYKYATDEEYRFQCDVEKLFKNDPKD
jgi:hypothetical protein